MRSLRKTMRCMAYHRCARNRKALTKPVKRPTTTCDKTTCSTAPWVALPAHSAADAQRWTSLSVWPFRLLLVARDNSRKPLSASANTQPLRASLSRGELTLSGRYARPYDRFRALLGFFVLRLVSKAPIRVGALYHSCYRKARNSIERRVQSQHLLEINTWDCTYVQP